MPRKRDLALYRAENGVPLGPRHNVPWKVRPLRLYANRILGIKRPYLWNQKELRDKCLEKLGVAATAHHETAENCLDSLYKGQQT